MPTLVPDFSTVPGQPRTGVGYGDWFFLPSLSEAGFTGKLTLLLCRVQANPFCREYVTQPK